MHIHLKKMILFMLNDTRQLTWGENDIPTFA